MACKIADEATYFTVKDCMNTIKKLEVEGFIKNFPTDGSVNFMTCMDPNIFEIYRNLVCDCHSGSSYACTLRECHACTLRECQYFLTYPDQWQAVLDHWANKTLVEGSQNFKRNKLKDSNNNETILILRPDLLDDIFDYEE